MWRVTLLKLKTLKRSVASDYFVVEKLFVRDGGIFKHVKEDLSFYYYSKFDFNYYKNCY